MSTEPTVTHSTSISISTITDSTTATITTTTTTNLSSTTSTDFTETDTTTDAASTEPYSTSTLTDSTTTTETTTTTTSSSSEEIMLQVLVRNGLDFKPIQFAEVICRTESNSDSTILTDENGLAMCGKFSTWSTASVFIRHQLFETLNTSVQLADQDLTIELFLSPILDREEDLRVVFVWKNDFGILDLHLSEFVTIASDHPVCELSSK
jgi:hypothetical protein